MSKHIDIHKLNNSLVGKTADEIIQWSLGLGKKAIVSTSFGPFSSVFLHMVSQYQPDIPVIWVDSGYNTDNTYKVAEQIIHKLNLNIHIYTPKMTAAYRDALMDGVPDVDSSLHKEFTRQVKLEPFQNALRDLKPGIWLTAIRKEETAFRQNLKTLTRTPNGILKVAPLLNWSELDMEEYLYHHDLPQVGDYYDPTKVHSGRECGLHTMSCA